MSQPVVASPWRPSYLGPEPPRWRSVQRRLEPQQRAQWVQQRPRGPVATLLCARLRERRYVPAVHGGVASVALLRTGVPGPVEGRGRRRKWLRVVFQVRCWLQSRFVPNLLQLAQQESVRLEPSSSRSWQCSPLLLVCFALYRRGRQPERFSKAQQAPGIFLTVKSG